MRPTVEEFDRELKSFGDWCENAGNAGDVRSYSLRSGQAEEIRVVLIAMFRRALEATDDE